MTQNVEPEEALAIRDLLQEDGERRAPAVAGRDFRRPRRLSGARLTELRERLLGTLRELEASVGALLGDATSVQLADLGEVDADLELRELRNPLAAARFTLGGQPAWVVCDLSTALGAVERIVGADPTAEDEAFEPRGLTPVETHVLGGLFATLVDHVCRTYALDAEELVVVADANQLGSWRDGNAGPADSHRLCLSFALEGSVPSGVVRVLLPGFLSGAGRGEDSPGNELPPHLAPVVVRARVRLGTAEVPLSELLALEEGDVIPLEVRRGSPVVVDVEGRTAARGVLGRHGGRYAVRIQELPRSAAPSDESK